ncbi:MAG: sugar phosphate isomerase/epimerase [Kiritimatiellae bacterium]|nr:sugar phosphate isomerase/epimerase [Kiritimatiellia bacterium]
MKKLLIVVLAAILAGSFNPASASCCEGCCSKEPRISVFASFVRKIAKERKIPLAQAAEMLYDLGVRGFDCGPYEKDVPELAATKLKPVNFYFFPRMFAEDKGAADVKHCFDLCDRYSVPRIMLVPVNFTKGGDEAAEFERILEWTKNFVFDAKVRGITVTIEDFGGTSNPCSHAKYLRRFLEEIPDIGFAYDTGNLYYAGRGEDICEFLETAKGRIAHVHLKDQTVENNRKYASLGLGAVPNEKSVKAIAASGYRGWYTLENPVGDTYIDTVRQVAVLKAWLAEAKKR